MQALSEAPLILPYCAASCATAAIGSNRRKKYCMDMYLAEDTGLSSKRDTGEYRRARASQVA